MDEKQLDRLYRLRTYFQASDRFMWGILPGNQKEQYDILENEFHLGHYYGGYDKVIKDILAKYRNNFSEVIKVVRNIIIGGENTYNNIDEHSLNEIRRLWNDGPEKKIDQEYLKKNNIHHELIKYGDINKKPESSIFFETDSYTKDGEIRYVYRWSEFAKIWFSEDIEHFNVSTYTITDTYIENQVTPESLSQTGISATKKLFGVLKTLPYKATENEDEQLVEKVLVFLALSAVSETQSIYFQLSKIIDFGQLLALAKIKTKDS